jgi:hypothetical protein
LLTLARETFSAGKSPRQSTRGEYIGKTKIDRAALRDDAPKMGLVLIGAGVLGVMIDSDIITAPEGLLLLLLGLPIWIAGLTQEAS